jgi:hypothetical protein
MGKPRVPLDPVADLKRRLSRARGASITKVRSILRGWWGDHELADHPATVGKRIALLLIEARRTEEKAAGILILQDQLGEQLRIADLPAYARLFRDGHLGDAVVTDWFATKVLATLVERGPEVGRQLMGWRTADTIWQRRAACLAFTKVAPDGDDGMPGLCEIVLSICATVVWSHERYDQTAVGFILRELSRGEPERVEAFFRRFALLMSKECARAAVAKFNVMQRTALLAHHKRATSLRR